MESINKYFTKTTKCPCKAIVEPDPTTGQCPPCVGTTNILKYIKRVIDDVDNGGGIKETQISNDETLNKMATITNCNSERCVLESNSILRYVKPYDVQEALDGLKPTGPRETREWLSNKHIDDVLGDLVEQYDGLLYTFPTTMSDFKSHGDKLGKSPTLIPKILEETGGKTQYFACIVNTDKYSSCGIGSCGKHWVAVFIDTSKLPDAPWTVEFFDSVGDPPNDLIMDWQKSMKESLDQYRRNKGHTGPVNILVNRVPHQKENNECGVYSLYYIMARTDGISQARFNSNIISDAAMINFRAYLFS